MANSEHRQILQQGVDVWNVWRNSHRDLTPDLVGADLRRANLRGVNFIGVNLTRANLSEARISQADLSRAILSQAVLRDADLRWSNFSDADLRGAILLGASLYRTYLYNADLRRADFEKANLSQATLLGANLAYAVFSETIFSATNLTAARGLETCRHYSLINLDRRTLTQSGPLPLAFLQGGGLNDWEIEVTKLYQTDLTSTQIKDIVYRIYDLRADPLMQFHSCFISYASRDQAFVERLYKDLQDKGVRCWYAPENMKIGDRLRSRIDEIIRVYDKLLLILSKTSVTSQWVEQEVETALERERHGGTTILFPLQIDNTVMTLDTGWPALIRNTRNIGDFRRWKTHDVYQTALARLLRDLTAAERQPGG